MQAFASSRDRPGRGLLEGLTLISTLRVTITRCALPTSFPSKPLQTSAQTVHDSLVQGTQEESIATRPSSAQRGPASRKTSSSLRDNVSQWWLHLLPSSVLRGCHWLRASQDPLTGFLECRPSGGSIALHELVEGQSDANGKLERQKQPCSIPQRPRMHAAGAWVLGSPQDYYKRLNEDGIAIKQH